MTLNQYTNPACPKCKNETILRKGKYGEFYGCGKYPECDGMVKRPKQTEEKSKEINSNSNKDILMVRMSVFRGVCDLLSAEDEMPYDEKLTELKKQTIKGEKWINEGKWE